MTKADARNKWRDTMMARGRCVQCTSQKAAKDATHYCCFECRVLNAARQRERWQARKRKAA